MRTRTARWSIALLVASVTSVATQTITAQTNHLNFVPGQIFRFGDTRDMDCTVQMRVTGGVLTNANILTSIRILQAVDDQGKDLNQRVTTFPRINAYPFNDHPGSASNRPGWLAILPLKCPGASARSIKQISGELDLAFPTVANGGLLKVTNFMANPGQIIAAPNLAKHGIKLTFHTFESYVDFQRANPKKYVADTVLTIERNCFSGIYGSPTNPPRNAAVIAAEDPNKVLLRLAFETAAGKRMPATKTYHLSDIHCYHFQQPPPSDLNLIVTVAAPGVIRTEPFQLRDIGLPWIDR